MNAILFAVLLTSAAPAFEVQTLDGRALTGTLVGATADRLTIAAKEGNVILETRAVLTVVSQQKRRPRPRDLGVVVELTDGSVLRGRQYVARGSLAQITLADGDVIETPVAVVRTVQFQPKADGTSSEWSRLIAMKAMSDLLILRSEDTLDYHQGVLHDVTEETVRFDVDGEIVPVKRSKIFGLAYRHSVEAEWPPAICRITDSAGSQWLARSLALAGKLQWTTPTGLSVVEPLEDIAKIDFSAGKLEYLSDLKPDEINWTPFFNSQDPLPAAKRLYAPRFDRGFESNPLTLGGVSYAKGMAVFCRTELVYRLPERFSRFQAVVGIDDAARASGKVRLVVRGDDRVLLEADIAGSDSAHPIDLDVKDVRRLTILVDFAGGLSAGDRLLLCNARIIK